MMKSFLFIALCFFIFNPLKGQALTPQEEALSLFNDGKYSEALVKFKRYITLFPNDPKYKYYTGVCMVQSNVSLDDAIKYLTQASELAVPRDVYFYLGKANHLQYKFDEALKAYQKFADYGIKNDLEKLRYDLHVKMAKNGQNIYRYANVSVLDKEIVRLDGMYEYFNRWLSNGKFEWKPEKRFALNQSEKKWRYIPDLVSKNQLLYESNKTIINPNNDLYFVKKLENGKWSKPSNLGASVNSAEDEDYPYFNEPESALYFASKGFNSIGGYDIFKTYYNPDTRTWSDPENLGYPINSPYDDFMFVPSDDQQAAYFASNRETSGGNFTVYKIEFSKKYSYTTFGSDFKFRNELPMATKTVVKPVSDKKPPILMANDNANTISEIKDYSPSLLNQKDYNELLYKALHYQLKSDSISRLINEKKEIISNSGSESEKARLKSEIPVLEKSGKEAQNQADALYLKAREYEHTTVKKEEKKEQVTSDIARNAFNLTRETANTNPQSKSIPKKNTVYEFKVMANSPYKKLSDIPLDQPLPNGLIYRIQMGAFSKPIEPTRFKGIIPISGETVSNGAIIKYYAGLFNRMSDAEKALNKIKEYGFRDAYVIAFYNGKSIPTNRAKSLEN